MVAEHGCDQFVALLYLLINRARRRQDILPVPLVRNSCSKHAPDIDLGYHARSGKPGNRRYRSEVLLR